MKMAELVFIPSPISGHVASTIEMAKRIIDQDDQISATFLCMKFSFSSFDDAYIKSLVDSQPAIKLINLPQVVDPLPHELFVESAVNYICLSVESYIPLVRKTLTDIFTSRSNSGSTQVAGVVLDLFCMPLLDVADELGLPSYMLFTTNPGFLSFLLHLPVRHERIRSSFSYSEPDLVLPGWASPVPTGVLPSHVVNEDAGYTAFLKFAQRFRRTKGILANSFAELEPHDVVSSLRSDGKTPPIYLVGPVIELKSQPHQSMNEAQREKTMKWLDEQPNSSVLFLCFGSIARFFDASQLGEIALGLERCGYRFLWCIRLLRHGKLTPDEITLPEGFLERTKGRGMVCEWAPQVEVLAHKATGGFVTHCGWNSILESLWHGVPIATWPIYAEQQLNALRMVREFKLAVEVRVDYREGDDDVTAEEIVAAVRRLMEDSGELRKRVKEMGKMSRKAVAKGGSSFIAVGELIKAIKGSN